MNAEKSGDHDALEAIYSAINTITKEEDANSFPRPLKVFDTGVDSHENSSQFAAYAEFTYLDLVHCQPHLIAIANIVTISLAERHGSEDVLRGGEGLLLGSRRDTRQQCAAHPLAQLLHAHP